MEERTIKRSIRIPNRLHEVLERESRSRGKSVNQVILEDLGARYGIEVGNRKRRKEMVEMYQIGAQQGWQCPLCKRIYGPFVPECLRCNNVETTLKIGDNPEQPNTLTIDWTKHISKTSKIPTFYLNIDGKL